MSGNKEMLAGEGFTYQPTPQGFVEPTNYLLLNSDYRSVIPDRLITEDLIERTVNVRILDKDNIPLETGDKLVPSNSKLLLSGLIAIEALNELYGYSPIPLSGVFPHRSVTLSTKIEENLRSFYTPTKPPSAGIIEATGELIKEAYIYANVNPRVVDISVSNLPIIDNLLDRESHAIRTPIAIFLGTDELIVELEKMNMQLDYLRLTEDGLKGSRVVFSRLFETLEKHRSIEVHSVAETSSKIQKALVNKDEKLSVEVSPVPLELESESMVLSDSNLEVFLEDILRNEMRFLHNNPEAPLTVSFRKGKNEFGKDCCLIDIKDLFGGFQKPFVGTDGVFHRGSDGFYFPMGVSTFGTETDKYKVPPKYQGGLGQGLAQDERLLAAIDGVILTPSNHEKDGQKGACLSLAVPLVEIEFPRSIALIDPQYNSLLEATVSVSSKVMESIPDVTRIDSDMSQLSEDQQKLLEQKKPELAFVNLYRENLSSLRRLHALLPETVFIGIVDPLSFEDKVLLQSIIEELQINISLFEVNNLPEVVFNGIDYATSQLNMNRIILPKDNDTR